MKDDDEKLTRVDAVCYGRCIDEITGAESAGQLIVQSNQLRSSLLHPSFVLFFSNYPIMPERSHSLLSSERQRTGDIHGNNS